METPSTSRRTAGIVLGLCYLVWILRPAALLCRDCRVWGCNHLSFLPDGFLYTYILLGVLPLLLLIPRIESAVSKGMAEAANLFDARRFVWWMLLSAAAVILFGLLRQPVTLLGDGYAVVNNIGGELPVVFKWSEGGAIQIVYWVSRLLPVEGLDRGADAYAIVSVVSGGLSVFLFAAIAFEVGQDRVKRLFVFALLLFSGWMLLFFGYTENYVVLWPFFLGYIYAALRYLTGRNSLFWPLLLYFAASYIHLQTIFFAPSLLVLFFARGWGRRVYTKYAVAVWSLIAVVLAAGTGVFVWKYLSSLGFMVHFLPPFTDRPTAPGYTIFAPRHLVDIINLIFLLIPVWPALLYLAWKNKKKLFSDFTTLFFAVLSVGGIVFVTIVDPRLGMARDWDLFALCMLGPALLLLRLSGLNGMRISIPASIVLIAFSAVLPYVAANVSKEPSISYLRFLCDLDPDRSRTGLVTLRNYFYDTGDTARAVEIEAVVSGRFPQSRLADKVTALISEKRFKPARALADSIYNMNPYVVDGHNMKGIVFLNLGYLDSAEYYFKKSLELGQYEYRTYAHLAALYSRKGNKELMWRNLRRAQELNPEEFNVIHPLAMSFYVDRNFDSAIVYGRKLIGIDPEFPDGYLVSGLSAVTFGDFESARRDLRKYLQLDSTSDRRAIALRTLHQIDSVTVDNK